MTMILKEARIPGTVVAVAASEMMKMMTMMMVMMVTVMSMAKAVMVSIGCCC